MRSSLLNAIAKHFGLPWKARTGTQETTKVRTKYALGEKLFLYPKQNSSVCLICNAESTIDLLKKDAEEYGNYVYHFEEPHFPLENCRDS